MACQLNATYGVCPVCGLETKPLTNRCPRCGSLIIKGCENCSGCSVFSWRRKTLKNCEDKPKETC